MSTEIQAILTELKAAFPNFDAKIKNAQERIDALEQQRTSFVPGRRADEEDGIGSFVKQLGESRGDFDRMGRMQFKTPSLLQTKATITSTGNFAAAPALSVAGAGRNPYTLREIFRSVTAGAGSVFGVRTTAEATSPLSQSSEGAEKSESSYTLTGETISIPTIATFVNVSRQALDDVVGLGEFLRTTLHWGLQRELERQLLDGDGSNGEMRGLLIDGEAFDTSLLTAADGYEVADIIASAACQLRETGYRADFFVVHPRTWLKAILTKDSTGRYILGDPQSAAEEQLWQMKAVVSDQLGSGYFLVGDSTAAIIRPRTEAVMEISNSHSDNFTRNKLTILAEERVVLQKLRPDAFVWGSTVTSPV